MKTTLALFTFLFLAASLGLAAETPAPTGEKVVKVYIMKAKKAEGNNRATLLRFDYTNVEVASPTDAELAAAKKAIEEAGIKPEDLKEDQVLPLEIYVLQVKKAYGDQPKGKVRTASGIRVEKPTEEDLDNQRKMLKILKDLRNFFKDFEFQMGIGGTLAASPALNNAYRPGVNFNFGFGYHFSEAVDLMMVLEGNRFQSNDDALTGGYEFSDFTGEFLLKLRLSSKGVRPYLFGGPAFSTGSFDIDYTYNNLYEHRTYRDKGHFSAVGGLGVEIPVWESTHFYIQGELAYDFLGAETVNFIQLDQPIRFVPISIGLVFGR